MVTFHVIGLGELGILHCPHSFLYPQHSALYGSLQNYVYTLRCRFSIDRNRNLTKGGLAK
jgi:hypothetical protein